MTDNPFVTLPHTRSDTVKLAISSCSNRPIEPRCAMALAMMVHYTTAFQVPFGLLFRLQASLLMSSRQECLDEAINDGCTHQLWWDDDIEMPADCVLRMLDTMKKNPEIDVIAANYCRKQDELRYTAEDLDGNMMESYGKTGLQEADKVGMGLMLVKLRKLRAISAPHFEVKWSDKHKQYRGEDRYFTAKLREHGMRIFVDHDISNWTQHWGSLGYSYKLWHPDAQAPPLGKIIILDEESRERVSGKKYE